jgi:integrase
MYMPVRRDKSGRWRYREVIELARGERTRVNGSAPRHDNTKAACERELRSHIARLREQRPHGKEVPTFEDWFTGRFWNEWVLGEENKPSTRGEKDSVFRMHLRPAFGLIRLDAIDTAAIQRFKADLKGKVGRTGEPLSPKTRNNILAVLSKALRYAEEVEIIDKVPAIRLYRVERPEIVYWEFEEYGRLVDAARETGAAWRAAVLLAGEAGLRLGELLALRWEHIDSIAGRITVARQVRQGQEGTPKGRTRRSIPMTHALDHALRSLYGYRAQRGRVLRHGSGADVTEGEAKHEVYRICKRAGLPARGWHAFRHTMATHAARLGVNPWSLQRWLGHKRIDETMRYVHMVEEHPRPIPEHIIQAGQEISDPDARIIAMLGARACLDTGHG